MHFYRKITKTLWRKQVKINELIINGLINLTSGIYCNKHFKAFLEGKSSKYSLIVGRGFLTPSILFMTPLFCQPPFFKFWETLPTQPSPLMLFLLPIFVDWMGDCTTFYVILLDHIMDLGSKGLWFMNYEWLLWSHKPNMCKPSIFTNYFFKI